MNAQAPIIHIISQNPAALLATGGRIYPVIAPQNAVFPCVIISVQSVNPSPTHDGPSKVDSVQIELRVVGKTYADAANTSEAVRQAIDGFRGDTNHAQTLVPIDGITYVTSSDGIIDETDPYLYFFADTYRLRIPRNYIIGSTPVYGPLQSFWNDQAAINAGYQTGYWYLLAEPNEYGIPGGIPKKIT